MSSVTLHPCDLADAILRGPLSLHELSLIIEATERALERHGGGALGTPAYDCAWYLDHARDCISSEGGASDDGDAKAAARSDTLCWHCSHPYPIVDHRCPSCGAANPNIDIEQAYREMDDASLIPLPALLREQAA